MVELISAADPPSEQSASPDGESVGGTCDVACRSREVIRCTCRAVAGNKKRVLVCTSRATVLGNRFLGLRKSFLVLEKSFLVLMKPSPVPDKREPVRTSRATVLGNRFPVLRKSFLVLGKSFLVLRKSSLVLRKSSLVLRKSSPVLRKSSAVLEKSWIVLPNHCRRFAYGGVIRLHSSGLVGKRVGSSAFSRLCGRRVDCRIARYCQRSWADAERQV